MITYEIEEYVEGNTINVTFFDENSGIEHTRSVNVVFTDGEYDEALTIERVEQVAMGVSHKIAVGVITNNQVLSAEIVPLVTNTTPSANT